MAENSKIEWTDHTFNPWIGCQKVSPGCDHCYAEAMMDHRFSKVEWGPHGERKRTSDAYWKQPLRWAKQTNGKRPRVFCASLADVFDNRVPQEWRRDLWELIQKTRQLDWLLLTKRPENISKMLPAQWPLPNVWLGTTIESSDYWHRYASLSAIPAVVRFISYEPALGALEIGAHMTKARPLPNWIICGGESGAGARDMPPAWARDVRDECHRLGIAFFMKQMTRKAPIPPDLMVRQFPQSSTTPDQPML
jgi:protein gp37